VDRALGAAASLGLSLAILRFVVSAYKAAKRLEGGQDDRGGPKKETGGNGEAVSDAFYSYFRRLLRRFLLDDENDSATIGKEDDYDYNTAGDGAIITHQGSCHCESVQFEVLAPRCLAAQDGPGKIQYRHTQIKTSNFRVVKGEECLRTYYVVSQQSSSRGAHAFCERCGVHILYAPCKNSPTVRINVNCVAEGIRKVRMVSAPKTISDGAPVEGQWDDQLSTISEVTGESRFMHQLQLAESTLSNGSNDWKGYQLYDRNEEFQSPDYMAHKSSFPVTPGTPSTVDSFAASDSQFSALIIPAVEQDSIATETESTGSSTQVSNSTKPTRNCQQATGTPQLRDQMRYFMSKHLSSSTKEEEKKALQ
jgi:hypothetical protein